MSLTHENILSLSFSRNRLGLAVFRRGHLDYYAGKTLSRYRSTRGRNRGMESILNELIRGHDVSTVAFPWLNKQQRHSSQLCSLYRAIQKYCAKNGLPVITQDPVQIRRELTGDDEPSKANLKTHLVRIFPELGRYASGGAEWERRYYGHIFTAIGCGVVATGFAAAGSGEGVFE